MQADVEDRLSESAFELQVVNIECKRTEGRVRAAKTSEPQQAIVAVGIVRVAHQFVGQAEREAADDVDDESADRPGVTEQSVRRCGSSPTSNSPDGPGDSYDQDAEPQRRRHSRHFTAAVVAGKRSCRAWTVIPSV